MRFTNKLNAQHLGWMFKKHWQVQGKRVPRDTGANVQLEKLGIQVKDATDVILENRKFEKLDIIGFKPPVIAEDRTHPNWNNKPCYVFGDSNVPLEGVSQAQLLTKAITIEGFPKNIEESISKIQLSRHVNKSIQNSIMTSHVLDAQQEKLAIVKIPERPAYNLPRSYGITDNRKNRLLISKLIFECEKLAGRSIASQRRVFNNADFVLTTTKGDDKLQFALSADTFITSKKPIEPVKGKYEGALPDLFPIKDTITIPTKNIYVERNFYPITKELSCSHPHTIFAHFSKGNVRNLYETPVNESQFQSRTLLKAFTVAAARAQQLYGPTTQNLPKPIVVQSVQTDGKTFHFGVFQLNTLSLDGSDGIKNYWFHLPNVDLFTECSYQAGRPVLEGFNNDVFRYLSAFYNNC